MTKRDYEAIAKAIAKGITTLRHRDPPEVVAQLLADEIADTLQSENPRFDRARFLKACGL